MVFAGVLLRHSSLATSVEDEGMQVRKYPEVSKPEEYQAELTMLPFGRFVPRTNPVCRADAH